MARKKAPRTIKASSIQSVNPEPTREKKNISTLPTKWIPFFKDTNNNYVNDLALRYRRSATMASIINSKVNYSVGGEWLFSENDEPIEKPDENLLKFMSEANNEMQDLKDVFKDLCFNWITFGNVYLEVNRVPVKGTTKYASTISVHDSTKVRISKDKKAAYISSFWRDIQNSTTAGEYPEPTMVALWDNNKETTQGKFIIHVKRSMPEYDYYGLPDYVATLKDADIEYQVDTYNLTRLENGFFPSAIVSLFGEPPEGLSDKQYIDKLKDKYSGSANSGQPLFQLLDDASQAAQITEFTGSKEGEFQALEDSAKKGIIEGHRWFPALAGIETAGKLGSNQEIINQWRVVMESVVKPDYQKPMLRLLNRVLGMLGHETTLDVLNVPPVGYEDKLEASYILTVNEQREQLGIEPKDELEDKYLIKVRGGTAIASLEEAEQLIKEEVEQVEEKVEQVEKKEDGGND